MVPALILGPGVGLIGAALFATDPVAGFPPRQHAPDGAIGTAPEAGPTRAGQLHTLCAIPALTRSSSVFLWRLWSARVLPRANMSTAGRRTAQDRPSAWLAPAYCSASHSLVRRNSFDVKASSSASHSRPDSDG